MTKAEIISTINDFLVDEFEIEEDAIQPEASWKEVGIDSLDFVDIVVVVENVFGVHINGQDMSGIKNLQEFYDFIEARIKS